MPRSEPDWRRVNRARWDELAGVHMGPDGYDLAALRAGNARLNAIEEAELPPVAGIRVLHLQCHFGKDTLTLAQRGAEVTGLDFSEPAIAGAQLLASELGLADRARFVAADIYDAPAAVPPPHGFDLVYVTWGALCWLPDIARWAQIVAAMLRPGGALYLAEGHPAALVFDDAARTADGRPGWFSPYFARQPIISDNPADYIDSGATLEHAAEIVWIHPLCDILGGLFAAGMSLSWLHEHDGVPWRMFDILERGPDGLWRWPDQPWLPISYSLRAERS
jgi:SAM-dependent methyltransferase